MTTTSRQWATCHVCGRRMAIRLDGLMRLHRGAPRTDGRRTPTCEGSFSGFYGTGGCVAGLGWPKSVTYLTV